MKTTGAKNNLKRRNDIILITALLLISVIGLVYLFGFRESGDTVKVTVDGEFYGVYSLSENTEENIKSGENGDGYNRLVIKNGKAYVASASCPDGICAAHRPVFRNSESIVCLPNKIVITVITADEQDTPDIVA